MISSLGLTYVTSLSSSWPRAYPLARFATSEVAELQRVADDRFWGKNEGGCRSLHPR